MFTNDIKKPIVSANVDDLINLLAVQLFMPFTTNILDDKSWNNVSVANIGVTLGSEGAVFNGGANKLSFKNNLPDYYGDFTFEVILNISAFTEYNYFFVCNGVNHSFGITFQKSTKQLRILNYGFENNYFDYSAYFDKTTHVAIVCKGNSLKVFCNGNLIGEIVKPPSIFLRINGADFGHSEYYIKGTVGGLKITTKALEPAQFSMIRSIQLKYPNFKVDNREYVYKDGIWNPDFEKQITGSTVFENNSIKIPPNSSISISRKGNLSSNSKIACAYKSSGYSGTLNYGYHIGFSVYNESKANTGNVTEVPISISGINITKEISIRDNKINSMSIDSGSLQTNNIYEIWVE